MGVTDVVDTCAFDVVYSYASQAGVGSSSLMEPYMYEYKYARERSHPAAVALSDHLLCLFVIILIIQAVIGPFLGSRSRAPSQRDEVLLLVVGEWM